MVLGKTLGPNRHTVVVPYLPRHTYYASPGKPATVPLQEATTATARVQDQNGQVTGQPVQKLFWSQQRRLQPPLLHLPTCMWQIWITSPYPPTSSANRGNLSPQCCSKPTNSASSSASIQTVIKYPMLYKVWIRNSHWTMQDISNLEHQTISPWQS